MSSKYSDDTTSSSKHNESEEEADASEAFATCESMANTLADLFADDSADGIVGFTNEGNAEELPLFCIVADWWAEEHSTWFTDFSNKHCHLWNPDTDLADTDDIECKLEWTEVHHDFLNHFEKMVEGFIATQGSTVEDFIVDAKKLMDGVSLTLFEETAHTDCKCIFVLGCAFNNCLLFLSNSSLFSFFHCTWLPTVLNSVFSCLEYIHFHKIMINAGRRKKFGGGRNRKHKGKSKKERRFEKAKKDSEEANAAKSSKK